VGAGSLQPFLERKEIDARLDTIMRHAIESVWQKAQALAIPLRTAAWALACERILQASKDRGLYS
jgi:glutamate dehydrogenase (NAD(P)+)